VLLYTRALGRGGGLVEDRVISIKIANDDDVRTEGEREQVKATDAIRHVTASPGACVCARVLHGRHCATQVHC
jgi:hypothetical protein